MTGSIFVSYRRSDAQGWAGHLGEALVEAFGQDPVFFDLGSIPPGEDFLKAIEATVASAAVFLALVGPTWLTVTRPDGRRRLDDPKDVVRLELSAALLRNMPVIPILLGGATMPRAEDLPGDLAAFSTREALDLTDQRWAYDFGRLAQAIEDRTGWTRRGLAQAQVPDAPPISVARDSHIEDVEAGDIAGIKATDASTAPGHGAVDVLRGATVKRAKLGDIVGIKIEPDRGDDR